MNKIMKALGAGLSVFLLSFWFSIPAQAMQIFVNVDVDDGQKHIALEVEPTDRIEDLKAIIKDKTGDAIENQVLIFAEKVLETGNTIQDYSIQKDSTIRLHAGRALSVSEGKRG